MPSTPSGGGAGKTSVIGAVVSRDPATGTRQLKNPKSGRTYDMLFLTLADHTGTRVKAQLIGKKARACASALDGGGGEGGGGGGGRVVIGLCGVLTQDRRPGSSGGGGATVATVWDPKEESTLVIRPDHPMALKL